MLQFQNYFIYFWLTNQLYYVFFSLFVLFSIPIVIENAKLKLALAIPVGTPITGANDEIEMLPLIADKTIKDLPK